MRNLFVFLFLTISWHTITAQIYSDYLGGGQAEGITVTSSDNTSEPIRTLDGSGLDLDIQGSSRFLAHATLGFDIDEVEALTHITIEEWIDDQLQREPSDYQRLTEDIYDEFYMRCEENLGTQGDTCRRDLIPDLRYFRYAWWEHTLKGEDKLRQRVAMALSEIFVISDQSQLNNTPEGLGAYYDILNRNALGNFRDLLTDVTLSPMMGFYLSHFNNRKASILQNTSPDENYAREIMQLFTIGLYELQQNGVRKIDMSTGQWIPTYDNDDIKEMAKVFTGLSGSKWVSDTIQIPVQFGLPFLFYNKTEPMAMYQGQHDPSQKNILKDHTLPSGQLGMKDIEDVLDILFNHENVGPFIGRRLIQRLVKSNPSPDYIERISAVFADNGSGVRGDMSAVVKAILLDPEALECYWISDESAGMLREPMVRYTQLLHGLKANTLNGKYYNLGRQFQEYAGQHVLSSPTVFNFFTPDYVPNSEFAYLNLVGPEFQILNSSTSSNYVNYMLAGFMRRYINNLDIPGLNIGSVWNLIIPIAFPHTPNIRRYEIFLDDPLWLSLAEDSPAELVDYLDILFTNGQLSEDTKDRIVTSISNASFFDAEDRANYAAFMIMVDPDYVIMK